MAEYNINMTEGVTYTIELGLANADGGISALNYLSADQTTSGTGMGIRAIIRHGNNSDADEAGQFAMPFVASDPEPWQNHDDKARDGYIVLTAPDLQSGEYFYAIEGTNADGRTEQWLRGKINTTESIA